MPFSLGLALVTTLVLMRAVSDANAVVINHLAPAKEAAFTLRLHTRLTDDDGATVVMARTLGGDAFVGFDQGSS